MTRRAHVALHVLAQRHQILGVFREEREPLVEPVIVEQSRLAMEKLFDLLLLLPRHHEAPFASMSSSRPGHAAVP